MIAAIDSKRGLATEEGIPWDLPADKAYFREKTTGGKVVMGYRTYLEFVEPLQNRINYVVTDGTEPLRAGFEPIMNVGSFLEQSTGDVWIIGGANIYAETLKYAEELHLTKLTKDFHCTKFFPQYEQDFERVSQSGLLEAADSNFRFCVYKRKR